MERISGVRALEAVTVVSIALFVAAAAPALGATVTEAPTVSGDPASGNTLVATTGAWTPTARQRGLRLGALWRLRS